MFNSKYSTNESNEKFTEIPRLMVGFDTETTGLFKPATRCKCPEHAGYGGFPVRLCPNDSEELRKAREKDSSFHEPVTYALTVYKNGVPHGRPESWVVKPTDYALGRMMDDPKLFAYKTHGWSPEMLNASYNGLHIKQPSYAPGGIEHSTPYQPAINRVMGFNRAARRLGELQRQGAVIVGAHVLGFDLAMLKHHYERENNEALSSSGLDLNTVKIFDVIRQHQVINPSDKNSKGQPTRRPLSDSKVNEKEKDTLCDIYGVQPGNHTATEDNRAAIEVALQQIATNRGEFTPNPIRLK